jgi:nucleoid-associated protein YgaU
MAIEKTLEKLTLRVETGENQFDKEIIALFNPNQITIQKSAKWSLAPKPESDTAKTQFTYGEPATLTMELFFNTYEAETDVRDYTKEIFHLTTVEEHGKLHRPPLCKLEWGKFNISDTFQCEWVLQSLNQKFTLFLADGTPVRATLNCTFKQWRGDEVEEKLLDKQSADVAKKRTVRQGDSLSSLAGEEYNDPTLWRPIAEENEIDDPFNLEPGRVLAIPMLRSRSVTRR